MKIMTNILQMPSNNLISKQLKRGGTAKDNGNKLENEIKIINLKLANLKNS